MHWSNKACVPQLWIVCSGAREPQLLSLRVATAEAHRSQSPSSPAKEASAFLQQWRPSTIKIKSLNYIIFRRCFKKFFGCTGSSLLQNFSSCEEWELLLLCCLGFPLPSFLLLQSMRSRSADSVAVAPRLSCSMTSGIFQNQGSNPCPLPWQMDSHQLYQQGSPTSLCICLSCSYL